MKMKMKMPSLKMSKKTAMVTAGALAGAAVLGVAIWLIVKNSKKKKSKKY